MQQRALTERSHTGSGSKHANKNVSTSLARLGVTHGRGGAGWRIQTSYSQFSRYTQRTWILNLDEYNKIITQQPQGNLCPSCIIALLSVMLTAAHQPLQTPIWIFQGSSVLSFCAADPPKTQIKPKMERNWKIQVVPYLQLANPSFW